ncbi:MAG: CaiB/BaiF CoA transferase family protein, partial [Dehalococcoidia bacterium]
MAHPLAGIKILDFGIAYSAPLASMMLGDMGADVIKVERVWGESIRRGRPAAMDELDKVEATAPDAPAWLSVNRSKRSLAVDIRQERGKEIVLKLAKDADVLLECFRPGVMDKLGFGYETISRINPRIIYCSQSGYGEVGPYARRVGGDMWAQAMGGVVSYQGSPNGPPYMTGIAFVDQGSPAILAFGIVVALFARERTGIGQHLSSSLLQAVLHMQSVETSDYLVEGQLKVKTGRGMGWLMPSGAYRAKDGDLITIFGWGAQWPTFCKVLQVEHLVKDPRFATDEARNQHREELYPLLDEAFSKKTKAEWQKLFREARMRCDPCLDYEELFAHPQVAANEMVVSL